MLGKIGIKKEGVRGVGVERRGGGVKLKNV